MKRLYFFSIILLITGACVERGSNNEAENGAYTSEEADANEIRDNSDFEEAFTNSPYFNQWDHNSDKKIGQDEFYKNYFTMIDENNDNVLSEQEWQDGIKSFFGSEGLGSEGEIKSSDFSKWDTNGDGNVQPEEFTKYLKDTQYFDEWDNNSDGQLEEKEFAEKAFHMWDTDGNGVIEADEFTEQDNKVDEGI